MVIHNAARSPHALFLDRFEEHLRGCAQGPLCFAESLRSLPTDCVEGGGLTVVSGNF